MDPSTSKSFNRSRSDPKQHQQHRTFSSTSYRDQSNQIPNSSSPPPFSSSPHSSSPPISPTFEYTRTSSSTSSFADPLAANAKSSFSSKNPFSRRDSRVGRATATSNAIGIGNGNGNGSKLGSSSRDPDEEADDGLYLEPGSPSSGRGYRSLGGANRAGGYSNRGKKRSLPVSPQQSQTTTSLNGHLRNQRSSPGDDDDDDDQDSIREDLFTSNRLMPPPSLESHKSVLGGQEKWIAPPTEQAFLVLGGLFSLSDNTSASEDANSSSDDAMDWGKPDSKARPTSTASKNLGLGLGSAFQEKERPNRNLFEKARSFQRWPSDPHSAFGATNASFSSTSSTSHPSQRRRVNGSSPKKLTRAKNSSSKFGNPNFQSIEMELQDASEDSTMEECQQPLPSLTEMQTNFWRKVVSDTVGIDVASSAGSSFKSSRATLDASAKDLQFIHPCIADLKNYVSIAPPPPPDKADWSSSPRSSTKDNPAPEEDPHSFRNKQFAASVDRRSSILSRTNTPQNAQQALNGSPNLTTVNGSGVGLVSTPNSPVPLGRTSSSKIALPSYEHLTLLLAQNQLTVLPSALFEVTKLTFLSLRNNKLRNLPPAIGELQNLREFSIGGNLLTYLPSEILKLNNLTNFTYHPNPWKRAPPDARLSVRPLLGSSAWRLVASSRGSPRRTREESEAASLSVRSNDDPGSSLPQVKRTEAHIGLMGPPALPPRFQAPGNQNRARMLERTVSDAQVDDLLAQGGELGSIGTNTSDKSSNEPIETSPFPCEGRARYLSPVEITSNVPSLQELCVRALLSPQAISLNSPTINRSRNKILLDNYENGVLRKCKGQLSVETMKTLEAARRSSGGFWGSSSSSFGSSNRSANRSFSRTLSSSTNSSRLSRSSKGPKGKANSANWCSEAKLTDHSNWTASDLDPDSTESDDADLSDGDANGNGIGGKSSIPKVESTPIDVDDAEASLDNGDDASKNAFFSRCPNPYHSNRFSPKSMTAANIQIAQEEEGIDWPLPTQQVANIFWEPVETRFEWISHIAGLKVASSNKLKTRFTGIGREVEEDSKVVDSSGGNDANGVENNSDADGVISGENLRLSKTPAVDGSDCIPIMWRGCSKGCLRFLEEVEE